MQRGARREAVDEAVDEELVGAADAAVLLRHHAHQLADLGLDGLAVGGVARRRRRRRGPSGLPVSSAAIAICRRGSAPNDRCRPITPTGVLAACAHAANAHGRGRGAERGQHARAALQRRPPAHAVAAQVAAQPLLLLADRHRRGQVAAGSRSSGTSPSGFSRTRRRMARPPGLAAGRQANEA